MEKQEKKFTNFHKTKNSKNQRKKIKNIFSEKKKNTIYENDLFRDYLKGVYKSNKDLDKKIKKWKLIFRRYYGNKKDHHWW
ncbi:hypothetical protein [Mesomycoplasma lagogenitalium]|uniref:Uncharacterized protein n=1 Tax=Mesomycoplasma lagogenitalium TaxID=171286 RepID=A0ABY8LVZ3_9BACT|nr:hypothetical protein [Mesomycoplasma lagogenitalium]WGI36401.1 hypothetical protein QEG99_02925 [Mesomycoplasma lagogenitalium]